MRFGFGFGLTAGGAPSGGGGEAITILQQFIVSAVGEFAGGGVWTPASPGGLVAEIDLLNPAGYVESGGAVTEVINLVSSVSWAAASSCPYEATGLNGHPCLHPVDITDYFLSTEAAVVNVLDCPTTAKPYTLIYVVLPDSTTTGVVTFGVGNSGVASASTRTWGQRSGVSQYEYSQTSPAAVGTVRSTGAVSTSLNIIAWRSPGTGCKFKLNDAADDPNNTVSTPAYTPGTGPNRAALFCRPDSSPDSPAIQRFGALYLYDHELSDTDLTAAYDYLLARWS